MSSTTVRDEDDVNALLQHLWWEAFDCLATDQEYWAMLTIVGKHHELADYRGVGPPYDTAWFEDGYDEETDFYYNNSGPRVYDVDDQDY